MRNFMTTLRQILIKQKIGKIFLIMNFMLSTMCNVHSETNKNGVPDASSTIPDQGQEILQEEKANPEATAIKPELNPDLFGIWKTSEVLGDANGEMLDSEAYMEFNEDGSCSAWAGSGAGAGASWDEDRKNAAKGKWRFADKTLYLIDPVSGDESSASISVAGNKFMLTNGSNKRVFVKVELQ